MTLIAVVMALSALVAWGVAEWVHHRAEVLRLVQIPYNLPFFIPFALFT